MEVLSIIGLAVFFISMLISYVVIRRDLMRLANVAIIAGSVNVVALTVVGLAREADPTLSVIGGIAVGLGLTGAMVTMASFFQKNQPETLAAYDAMHKEREQQE